MEIVNPFVFQADSPIVNEIYENNPNYLIEYNECQPRKICAIYFSSNNIYYPNTEEAFIDSIKLKNKYEWFNLRIPCANKHLFLRDIKKQWYLSGINININSPQKLFDFLQEETLGYSVILSGSSAGGFASVLYGSLLKADKVYSFNGQFEIESLLHCSNAKTDPLIFRYADDKDLRKFYDVKPYINKYTNIFYFYSAGSQWDNSQFNHIKETNVSVISFLTRRHGIPFPKINLPVIFSLTMSELKKMTKKIHLPLLFSLKQAGSIKTIKGLFLQWKMKN
jgi:hypothetical protein